MYISSVEELLLALQLVAGKAASADLKFWVLLLVAVEKASAELQLVAGKEATAEVDVKEASAELVKQPPPTPCPRSSCT